MVEPTGHTHARIPAPTWTLIEGTARIALSRKFRSPKITAVDPQVVAELWALTGGGEAPTDQGVQVDELIEHLLRHVRYQVSVTLTDISVGHPESDARRPVLQITAARRGRGVSDLLADVTGYLVAETSTPNDASVPWLTVTSLAVPEATEDADNAVGFHSTTHLVITNPPPEDETGQTVVGLGQDQLAQIAATALASSWNKDAQPAAAEPSLSAAQSSTAEGATATPIAEATALDDIDVLLAGILRSVVAQIEQNQLDEDEAGDPAVLDDRKAVIETLVMAATMLEEHRTHNNPEVTNLVIANLRQLTQRSEATVPEHARANPAAALDALSGSTDPEAAGPVTNPAELSLAVAAELAADRIAQF